MSDYYYYPKYLSEHFEISFLEIDKGHPSRRINNIKYFSFNKFRNKYLAYYCFWLFVIKKIKTIKADVFIINTFPMCLLLRFCFPLYEIVYDIRSGGVNNHRVSRILRNTKIKINALIFEHIIIISDSLAKRLRLNPTKYHVMPLGAEVFSSIPKSFDNLRLFYIGTLNNRRISDTIIGFKKFIENNPESGSNYTIVGFGTKSEEKLLNLTIIENKLENHVKFLGRKSHDEITSILDTHNIGVSFIPLTPYYNVQPPTKTFEYLCSGMAVIATKTYENTIVINDNNGVLIEDTSDAFYEGLVEIYLARNKFDSIVISKEAVKYTWHYIVDNIYLPFINNLIRKEQIPLQGDN